VWWDVHDVRGLRAGVPVFGRDVWVMDDEMALLDDARYREKLEEQHRLHREDMNRIGGAHRRKYVQCSRKRLGLEKELRFVRTLLIAELYGDPWYFDEDELKWKRRIHTAFTRRPKPRMKFKEIARILGISTTRTSALHRSMKYFAERDVGR
jgi:hypothetical protein